MSNNLNPKQELLLKRAELDEQLAALEPNNITFSVDANIINRLGKELVGRAETAVSELIKNSYDADATIVDVEFWDTNYIEGKIIIKDNGHGMDREALVKGFMRVSSPDKMLNPVSPKFNRRRAGQKGIGRFATQRLGSKLTIISQSELSDSAIQIVIDWDKYEMNTDLGSVSHEILTIEKQKNSGTTLIIDNLRERWTLPAIKRIYRYVSELLQPNYDSTFIENSFDVRFKSIENDNETNIADIETMVFDRAIAVISGEVDNNGYGKLRVKSNRFQIDENVEIYNSEEKKEYEVIRNVSFQVYYFIYNRPDYYDFDYTFTRLEYNKLRELAEIKGGVRLYRNGFRVLPYGERFDDWLRLDVRWSADSGINAPFGTKNLFGYVSIPSSESQFFEETSSREGLIENDAFTELVSFVQTALRTARGFISESEGLYKARQNRKQQEENQKKKTKTKSERYERVKNEFRKDGKIDLVEEVEQLEEEEKEKEKELLNELAMLRVLSTLGLTIGEFAHEIRQFRQWFEADLILLEQNSSEKDKVLARLKQRFEAFSSYTAYFDSAISRNTQRELGVHNLNEVVDSFVKSINKGLLDNGIEFNFESYGTDLYTCPMHYSEWHSILLNLYTNSVKAIKRAKRSEKKIKIVVGKEGDRVYLEFADTGDGIKEEDTERVFNAFFTRSIAYDSSKSFDDLVGTGLGLFIVKNIISAYQGIIEIIPPETDYITCFKIELPKATQTQIDEYEA